MNLLKNGVVNETMVTKTYLFILGDKSLVTLDVFYGLLLRDRAEEHVVYHVGRDLGFPDTKQHNFK